MTFDQKEAVKYTVNGLIYIALLVTGSIAFAQVVTYNNIDQTPIQTIAPECTSCGCVTAQNNVIISVEAI